MKDYKRHINNNYPVCSLIICLFYFALLLIFHEKYIIISTAIYLESVLFNIIGMAVMRKYEKKNTIYVIANLVIHTFSIPLFIYLLIMSVENCGSIICF